ncbi:MAG: DUF2085 domain-containing protein [Promethearchaeota archaeon]
MEEIENSPSEFIIQGEKDSILRKIFLNILISLFIIMCYYYISDVFGSISSNYIGNTSFELVFGITLFIFVFFSVLAGAPHGVIAGFFGELLYQLAFYHIINIYWCIIIAVVGFLSGLYKYHPLKYSKGIVLYYTFIMLLITTFIGSFLIVIFQSIQYRGNLEEIVLNYGFKFFLQSLFSFIFIIPLLLLIYDYLLARKERHIYNQFLTHHPANQSDHTFYFKFGRTHIYFCSRCSGMIIGVIISMFYTNLLLRIYSIQITDEQAVFLCIILPIPGLIDWGTQRLLYRKSTTETRLLTGFLIGNALHFLQYTRKLSLFMMIIVIFYFVIFGIMMYFGARKEIRLYEKEYRSQVNPPIEDLKR